MTLIVITKEDLMKPPDIRDGRNYGGYNLSPYFIRMHGRKMGGIGKPMIFDRARVEAYLDNLFGEKERERAEEEAKTAAVDSLIEEARRAVRTATATPVGEIQGKGGKKRVR